MAQTPEPSILIKMPDVLIPEYYVGAIPHFASHLYMLVGIRFVHVVADTDYYIYEPVLAQVVDKLGLYM